jgi:catechol 1,2-dioxygenase
MIIKSQADVTPAVLEAYSKIDDPRLREIIAALVKHLHAFAREVHLMKKSSTRARRSSPGSAR